MGDGRGPLPPAHSNQRPPRCKTIPTATHVFSTLRVPSRCGDTVAPVAARSPRSNNHRVTPSGPDPPRNSTPPHYYGPAAWPVGFRGIGGHLIRPAPSAVTPAAGLAAEGAGR